MRFLIFRNLGPGRTVDRAYKEFLEENGETREGTERIVAPGQWRTDSTRFAWHDRAQKWDIAMLAEHGRETVVAFVRCLRRATIKFYCALDKLEGPKTWKQALETFGAISNLIPPETIKAVETDAGDDDQEEESPPQQEPERLPE